MTKTTKQRAQRRAEVARKHPEPTQCSGVLKVSKEVMDDLLTKGLVESQREVRVMRARLARIVAAWDAWQYSDTMTENSTGDELAAAIRAAREIEL